MGTHIAENEIRNNEHNSTIDARRVILVDTSGMEYKASGGTGGGGDASAAHQLTQIANQDIVIGILDRGDAVSFAEQDIAAAADVSVVTYTVPALKKFLLTKVAVSGDGCARVRVVTNGSNVEVKRLNITQMNLDFTWKYGLKLATTENVQVFVENTGDTLNHYEVSLYGVEEDQ